eukprot:scaffold34284_cov56-Cyclotella_meneghiniana.AAC.3
MLRGDGCNDQDLILICNEQTSAPSKCLRALQLNSTPSKQRRSFLNNLVASLVIPLIPSSSKAAVMPFFEPNHRQLEFILVTILRTQFWAMNIAKSLNSKLLSSTPADTELEENVQKLPYLEARLGAKAMLTQKIGGGATSTVLKVASFNIKECLEDGKYWCNQLSKSNQIDKRICTTDLTSISEDLVESLANIVEFDGLETTIDPSPRSSLMLSMYNPSKGKFIYRTLTERVIPTCERYLDVFGQDRKELCLAFVKRDYSDEIPFEVLMNLYDDESA